MQYNTMNFMLFFFIYGFLGFVSECVFRSFAERKLFISRGFLTNYFCPLYGICAILIIEIFTLFELSISNSLWSIIAATIGSMAIVTLLEYITGRFLDKVFHYKLWDYSQNPLNLHSYICVEFSLLWGIVALILSNFVHPVIEILVYAVPYNIRVTSTIAFLVILFVNVSLNIRKMYYLRVIKL